jgi:GDP-L-fucose synthase
MMTIHDDPAQNHKQRDRAVMDQQAKIYVAGHRGLAGSAIVRNLQRQGHLNLLLRTHADLDLTDQAATSAFFDTERPDYVFVAAAKVGGIHANNVYPAEFIQQNLAIQTNVIHSAWHSGVQRLLFLGSSCVYPRDCPQPIKEDYLLTGPLETTNQAYAIAKIAGIEMCRSYNQQYGTHFLAGMPTNLYGPGDSYDLQNSHVLPALIRKFHEGKVGRQTKVVVWGNGTPRREFLYSDDMGDAAVFLMSMPEAEFDGALAHAQPLVNIGYGEDLSIAELAGTVREVVGFTGDIVWDRSKPDGTPRKLTDTSRLAALGWRPKTSLRDGIEKAYDDFLSKNH